MEFKSQVELSESEEEKGETTTTTATRGVCTRERLQGCGELARELHAGVLECRGVKIPLRRLSLSLSLSLFRALACSLTHRVRPRAYIDTCALSLSLSLSIPRGAPRRRTKLLFCWVYLVLGTGGWRWLLLGGRRGRANAAGGDDFAGPVHAGGGCCCGGG